MSLIRYFCNYTSNGIKSFTTYLFICWFTERSEKGIGVVTWIDLPFDCPSDRIFRQKSYCLNTKVKYWKSVGVLFSPYILMKIMRIAKRKSKSNGKSDCVIQLTCGTDAESIGNRMENPIMLMYSLHLWKKTIKYRSC